MASSCSTAIQPVCEIGQAAAGCSCSTGAAVSAGGAVLRLRLHIRPSRLRPVAFTGAASVDPSCPGSAPVMACTVLAAAAESSSVLSPACTAWAACAEASVC